MHATVRLGRADLVRFPAGETGDAERIAQPEALVDLGLTQNSAPCQRRTPP